MANLELFLLESQPRLVADGVELDLGRFYKARDLLIYTADTGRKSYSRDALADYLFMQGNRRRLVHGTYELNKILGLNTPKDSKAAREYFVLPMAEDMRVDTHDFTRRAQQLLSEMTISPSHAQDIVATLGLYKTHFLSELKAFETQSMDNWRLTRQRQLYGKFAALNDQLVRFYFLHGQVGEAYKQVYAWLDKTLDDPEVPLQLAMWISVAHGLPSEALLFWKQLYERANRQGGSQLPLTEWRDKLHDGDYAYAMINNTASVAIQTIQASQPVAETVTRTELVGELSSLIVNAERSAVIGLAGLAGVGKTSFARSVIYELNKSVPHFTAVWLNQGPYDEPEDLLNRALVKLGLQSFLKHTTSGKRRRLNNILKARNCLIVIDEAFSSQISLPEYRNQVLSFFESARVLMITREILEEQAYIYKLTPFTGDGVRLFIEREVQGFKDVSGDYIKRLTAVTGGLPLALTLATGFHKKNLCTLGEFVNRLRAEIHEPWTYDTASAHYHTMLTMLWGYLNTRQHTILYALTLYDMTNGIELETIVSLIRNALSLSRETVESEISYLVELGLLTLLAQPDGGSKYTLHTVIYEFLLTGWHYELVDIAAVRRAFTREIMHILENTDDEYRKVAAYHHEVINMFRMVFTDEALEGERERAIFLLNYIYEYFDRRAYYELVEGLIQLALNVTPSPHPEQPLLLANAARAIYKLGGEKRPRAYEMLSRALELARRLEATNMRSVIMREMGRYYIQERDYDRARATLEEGLQAAIEEEQPLIGAQIASNLAVIDHRTGKTEQMKARLVKILAEVEQDPLADKYEYRNVLQFANMLLGLGLMDAAEYDESVKHLEAALDIARRLDNAERIARRSLNMAAVSYYRGDLNDAWEYLTHGDIVMHDRQHLELQMGLLWNKGAVKIALGDLAGGHQLLHRALNIQNDTGYREVSSYIALWLGILALVRQQPKRAIRYFTALLALPEVTAAEQAFGLYGLGLANRVSRDLFVNAGPEAAQADVARLMGKLGLMPTQFSTISHKEMQHAEHYFKMGLPYFPELERYHVLGAIWSWLTGA